MIKIHTSELRCFQAQSKLLQKMNEVVSTMVVARLEGASRIVDIAQVESVAQCTVNPDSDSELMRASMLNHSRKAASRILHYATTFHWVGTHRQVDAMVSECTGWCSAPMGLTAARNLCGSMVKSLDQYFDQGIDVPLKTCDVFGRNPQSP